MLEQHLQQPSQKLDLGYDPIIGGIGPMFEQNLPFINELSTATDFDDGEFRTNHNSYFIFREDIDMRITSFDGEITLLEFWEPSAFRTSEHSLTFLRSMKSNLINNMDPRSEEHTSELQSLMRISYAVFCLHNKKNNKRNKQPH